MVRPWYNRISVFVTRELHLFARWGHGRMAASCKPERVLTRASHAGTLILTLRSSEGKMNVCCWSHPVSGISLWQSTLTNKGLGTGTCGEASGSLSEQQMFPPQVAEQWSRQTWFPAHRELNLLIWLVAFSFSILLATKPQVVTSFEFCTWMRYRKLKA